LSQENASNGNDLVLFVGPEVTFSSRLDLRTQQSIFSDIADSHDLIGVEGMRHGYFGENVSKSEQA